MTLPVAVGLALTALVMPLAIGTAQRLPPARLFTAHPPVWGDRSGATSDTPGPFRPRSDSSRRATPWSVLASAIVPGTGQALLDQDRVVAYLAVEAYAWVRYAADVREGRRARTTYRNLASEVARRPFSTTRPIGDFEYYERMEKFTASGAFDAIPGGDLDPEVDTTTANGAIWMLARQTYWTTPDAPRTPDEYQFALTFYRERAVPADYQWSWGNARLEYAEFRRTIRRSNNAYRTSLQDLGLVIANHALSTVDAFITIRLRRHAEAGSQRFELFGSVPIP